MRLFPEIANSREIEIGWAYLLWFFITDGMFCKTCQDHVDCIDTLYVRLERRWGGGNVVHVQLDEATPCSIVH